MHFNPEIRVIVIGGTHEWFVVACDRIFNRAGSVRLLVLIVDYARRMTICMSNLNVIIDASWATPSADIIRVSRFDLQLARSKTD